MDTTEILKSMQTQLKLEGSPICISSRFQAMSNLMDRQLVFEDLLPAKKIFIDMISRTNDAIEASMDHLNTVTSVSERMTSRFAFLEASLRFPRVTDSFAVSALGMSTKLDMLPAVTAMPKIADAFSAAMSATDHHRFMDAIASSCTAISAVESIQALFIPNMQR